MANRVGQPWQEPEPLPENSGIPRADDRHTPCPVCGVMLTAVRDGRAMRFLHPVNAPDCSYLSMSLGPAGFRGQAPDRGPGPRRTTDYRYRWSLDHQKDFGGHDNIADHKAAEFRRKAREKPGRVEIPKK